MSDSEQTKRRYSEEEFALILRKASELQESPGAGSSGRSSSGLTLTEIQSIAREAGMDPQAVARAAAILGAMELEERSGLASLVFGMPGKVSMEFEVPGRLPPEELGRILELIRKEVGQQGETKEVLGGVEWKTVGDVSAVHVNLSPRGDSTSVQIVGDRSAAGALSFTFPIAGSAVLIGALGGAFEPSSAVGIASLIGGLLGSGFVVGRTIWVTTGRRFQRKLTRLMDHLSEAVERIAQPSGGAGDGGKAALEADTDAGRRGDPPE